jgi:rhodanese-related sulfurtransferase
MLLLAGTVLGLAHNQIGLQSRPVRGIPWRAVPPEPALERLAAADTSHAGAPVAPVEPTPRPRPASRPVDPPQTLIGEAEAQTRAPNVWKPDTSGPFVPETDKPVQITIQEAKLHFDAKTALFVDARSLSEYEGGHIPGAIRLTSDEALRTPDRVKALGGPYRSIVAYCNGGGCDASLELARVLVAAGYRRVMVYTGGFPEWDAAGLPVSRGVAR